MATDNEPNVANAFFSSALGPRCSHCWRRSRNSWNPWQPTSRSSSNPCLSLSWPSWNHWLNLSKPSWRISLRRWWPRPKPCFPLSKATGFADSKCANWGQKNPVTTFENAMLLSWTPLSLGMSLLIIYLRSLKSFKGDHLVTSCFLW